MAGDTARTDPAPALLDRIPDRRPTAGELRAAGYSVDAEVADAAVPTTYHADSPTPPGEVHLVGMNPPDCEGTPLERDPGPTAPAPVPRGRRR